MTAISFSMVLPSLVMIVSPLPVCIILSMPLGPRDVLIASATALAAIMFAVRTAIGFSLSLNALLLELPPALSVVAMSNDYHCCKYAERSKSLLLS